MELIESHRSTIMRRFRPKSNDNVDILGAHFQLCNWLDLKIRKLEARMSKFLKEETKTSIEKIKLEESHNYWFKFNGNNLNFQEDHFIGSTGVRYQNTRRVMIE